MGGGPRVKPLLRARQWRDLALSLPHPKRVPQPSGHLDHRLKQVVIISWKNEPSCLLLLLLLLLLVIKPRNWKSVIPTALIKPSPMPSQAKEAALASQRVRHCNPKRAIYPVGNIGKTDLWGSFRVMSINASRGVRGDSMFSEWVQKLGDLASPSNFERDSYKDIEAKSLELLSWGMGHWNLYITRYV